MHMALCPICNKENIMPPNGVCIHCYNHLKRDEVPSKSQIRNQNPSVSESSLEQIMQFNQEKWDSMIQDGLKAVYLAIIVVDEARHLPTWKEWHLRRIKFISDLIDVLPENLFEPISKEQMKEYKENAIFYWQGKISEEERLNIYNDFEKLLDKKTSNSTWDEKSLPLWTMMKRDFFDWMWEQFMDCIYECVSKEHDLSDEAWMKLFHKHFGDTLAEWIALS